MKRQMIIFFIILIIYLVSMLSLLLHAEGNSPKILENVKVVEVVEIPAKEETYEDLIAEEKNVPTFVIPPDDRGAHEILQQELLLVAPQEEVDPVSSDEVPDEDLYCESLLGSSNVSPEELANSLKHELKDLAPYFIEAEERYGVNALYLASISALESGWGRYQFKDNNIFGFGNMEFESEEECIYYVAEFLRREYLSEDGMYYNGGYTLHHVNQSYNGSDHWYDEVTSIFTRIVSRIEEYREVS